jgi:Leucine-rich repeat (LRR) protein
VRNDYVSRAGDDLNAIAGHLTEVDLQENLICQWQEIGNFGVALPLLTTLLLHGNKLEPLTAELAEYLRAHNCLAGLEVLALNGCGIRSWTTLQHLHNFLPNLQELYLSNNDLSDLPGADENGQVSAVFVSGEFSLLPSAPSFLLGSPVSLPPKEFPKLRILDVSFCQISDWSQLQAFGRLPALKELVLDGNPLSSLPAPAPDTFLELQRLSLGSTG